MAGAGETLRPGHGAVGALAGYALAATVVAGAVFFLCLGVLVFVHGNERLMSPLVRGSAPPGDLEALAEALVRPAGVALVLLAGVSAVLGRADRRRADR
jgi:hypothetical protein